MLVDGERSWTPGKLSKHVVHIGTGKVDKEEWNFFIFSSAVCSSVVALPLCPLLTQQLRDLSYAVTLPAVDVLIRLEADYVFFVNLILTAQQS